MDRLEADLRGTGVKVILDASANGGLVAPRDHGVQEAGVAARLQVRLVETEAPAGRWSTKTRRQSFQAQDS